MMELTRLIKHEIQQYAYKTYPLEACGVVAGGAAGTFSVAFGIRSEAAKVSETVTGVAKPPALFTRYVKLSDEGEPVVCV